MKLWEKLKKRKRNKRTDNPTFRETVSAGLIGPGEKQSSAHSWTNLSWPDIINRSAFHWPLFDYLEIFIHSEDRGEHCLYRIKIKMKKRTNEIRLYAFQSGFTHIL